jgi:hypothetical protein
MWLVIVGSLLLRVVATHSVIGSVRFSHVNSGEGTVGMPNIFHTFTGVLVFCFELKKSYFFRLMETLQVFIETEGEEKENVQMHQTQFLPEKLPYIEPIKLER